MLILHIGPMKTGTSTLQEFLKVNEKMLAGSGIIYSGIGRSPKMPHHHNLAHELLQSGYFNPALGNIDQLAAAIRAAPDKRFVVSSEMFLRLSNDQVLMLKGRLDGVKVRIVSYMRYPAPLVRSRYTQATKTGRNIRDFDSFFDHTEQHTRVSMYRLLVRWGTAFGWQNMHVRSLDQLRKDGTDLIQDFLGVLHAPENVLRDVQEPGKQNVSPDWRSVELLRSLYGSSSPAFQAERFANVTIYQRLAPVRNAIESGSNLAAHQTGLPDEPGDYFTERQLTQLAQAYESDAEYLGRVLPDLVLPALSEHKVTPRTFLPEAAVIAPETRRRFYECLAAHIIDVLRSRDLAPDWVTPYDLQLVPTQ